MAKTTWGDGSHITPLFMNSYIGTNASTGHNHQSLDATDSAPKINLTAAAEVWGELPPANMAGDIPLTKLADYTTGSFVMRMYPPYADSDTDSTCTFEKTGNVCSINIPDSLLCKSTANTEFRVKPASGNWPAAIVPSNNKWIGGFVGSQEHDDLTLRPAALALVQNDTTASWQCYLLSDGTYIRDDWGANGTFEKGILETSFTYVVD